MYLPFYGLKEKPFNTTPDPRFLFLTPGHREALAQLVYGVQENKGFLAVWTTETGKPVYAEEMAFGAFYSVAISPDDKKLALGGGPRGQENQELNKCFIIKMPATDKK